MRNPFLKKRYTQGATENPNPFPVWMKGLIFLFIIYALAAHHNKTPAPAAHEASKTGTTSTTSATEVKNDFHLSDYTKRLIPDFSTPLDTKDIEIGKGPEIFCGQEVKLMYGAYLADGTPVAAATEEKPLVFRIGDGKAPPALEDGIMGMKVGGKRTVIAAPEFAYGNKNFPNPRAPVDAKVRFDLVLLSATPERPDSTTTPFRVAIIRPAAGAGGECGKPIRVNLTEWNIAGEKLYSTLDTGKPLEFTIGRSEVFLGLDLGALGMSPGTIVTLIVPPPYQKTLYGEPPKIPVPFPPKQTVLVDVEALP